MCNIRIPKTTIQNVLHKHLRLHAYKIQLKQEIKPDDTQEIEFRLDVSRATNVTHIEMYWGKSKTLNFSEHIKTPNV